MSGTKDELLAIAGDIWAEAKQAPSEESGLRLAGWAAAIKRVAEALTDASRAGNVQPVTNAEKRRGRAIAKARAEQSDDPRRKAIAARWGSQAKAAKAAGISPGSLVFYLSGAHPTPRKVAAFFAVDPKLPATQETWKGGIVD